MDEYLIEIKYNIAEEIYIKDSINILSIVPFKFKYIFVETNTHYFIFEKTDEKLVKKDEIIKKETTQNSFFLYSPEYDMDIFRILEADEKEDITIIERKL